MKLKNVLKRLRHYLQRRRRRRRRKTHGRLWMLKLIRRAKHIRLGKLGEAVSCRALEEIGVEILCRNFKCGFGEIDIVARDGITLCFIEVKTRHRQEFWRPADAVDETRKRRYSRAAAYYRDVVMPGSKAPYRFDIMEVIYDGRRLGEMNYLRAAFGDRRRKEL